MLGRQGRAGERPGRHRFAAVPSSEYVTTGIYCAAGRSYPFRWQGMQYCQTILLRQWAVWLYRGLWVVLADVDTSFD